MSPRAAALSPALTLTVGLALLALAPAALAQAADAEATAASTAAAHDLLRSARIWEARARGDLARLAIEKLLRTRPGDTALLREIGAIEMRSNRLPEALKILEELKARAPQSQDTRDLDTAYRIATRDRLRFASARRLVETNREDEAMAALAELFPEGPPHQRLGAEYWSVVAQMPDRYDEARRGYEALVAANPDDPYYRLALAVHLARREASHAEAVAMLAQLSARPDLSPLELEAAARRIGQPGVAQAATSVPRGSAAVATARWPLAPTPGSAAENLRRKAEAARSAGTLPLALNLFEQAARLAPQNLDIRAGQVQTLAALGRADEALQLAASADSPRLRSLRAELLSRRAEASLQAGHQREALGDLEQAQALQPDDPWARYRLARLYADLGLPAEGRALMDEGARRASADSDLHYAQALYLSSIDADADALAALDRLPAAGRSQGMQDLDARLRLALARREAEALHAAGRADEAATRLRAAEVHAHGVPDRIAALARSWVALGQPDEALRLIDAARAQDPQSLPLGLARLRTLAAAGRSEEQRVLLRELSLRQDLGPEAAQQLAEAQRDLDLDQARALATAGDSDRALALIDARLQARPDDRGLASARAGLLADAGRWREAQAAYRALLQEQPDNLDLRLDLARALEQGGDAQAARAEVDTVLGQAPAADRDNRLGAARRLQSLGAYAEARAVLDALLLAQPADAAVLAQSARLERADGKYERALRRFEAAQGTPADADIAEAIAGIQARRQSWISAGLDTQTKPGDPGLSDARTRVIPVELRLPGSYDGFTTLYAEDVRLDVGRLPAVYADAALYGTVLAAGPASIASFAQGHDPTTEGLALGAAYQGDHYRVDIGTTPLGMPVQDLVGGLRVNGDWLGLDWSAEASRRPVTSSLVSFGGARDPVSGRVWGGVRENALSLRAAHYGERWSASASARASRLEGRHVLDNDYYAGRGSVDYKLYDGHGQQVFIGLSASYSGYSENQRYYSFGHGGYYSPQSYLVTGLPLEWRGRRGRWSYRFEGSYARTHSREDDALFYPTDPALQALASAPGAALPPGFDGPVYEGGGGTGYGYSLRGALEYRLTRRWALGGRAAVDRSDFYEPNFFNFYFRCLLDDGPEDVLAFPPRPPQRYTEY